MGKKLKTLEESNEQTHWNRHHDYSLSIPNNVPQLNDIACPKCGAELMDSQPMVILTSDPAQKTTQCSKCDYRGYRTV